MYTKYKRFTLAKRARKRLKNAAGKSGKKIWEKSTKGASGARSSLHFAVDLITLRREAVRRGANWQRRGTTPENGIFAGKKQSVVPNFFGICEGKNEVVVPNFGGVRKPKKYLFRAAISYSGEFDLKNQKGTGHCELREEEEKILAKFLSSLKESDYASEEELRVSLKA